MLIAVSARPASLVDYFPTRLAHLSEFLFGLHRSEPMDQNQLAAFLGGLAQEEER
jgi:hypothetical protein